MRIQCRASILPARDVRTQLALAAWGARVAEIDFGNKDDILALRLTVMDIARGYGDVTFICSNWNGMTVNVHCEEERATATYQEV